MPDRRRTRDIDSAPGKHRAEPIHYLDAPPVGCPRCQRGVMVVLSGENGDMYTCASACGQRYWVDR